MFLQLLSHEAEDQKSGSKINQTRPLLSSKVI